MNRFSKGLLLSKFSHENKVVEQNWLHLNILSFVSNMKYPNFNKINKCFKFQN